MPDLDRAIAAAREAFRDGAPDWNMLRAGVNLLAALDAARGEAVATVQTITSLVGETRKVIIGKAEVIDALPVGTAVYAAPPAALAAPLFLLHTGTVYGNERGDWEIEANSGKAVDAYCDANPGKTVGLYLAPPASSGSCESNCRCAAVPAETWPAGDGYPPELDYARAKRGDYAR